MICLLLLIGLEDIFGFGQIKTKKIKKLLACANHTSSRVADTDGCNGASTTSFDSSRRPLPPWMTCVWWFGEVWSRIAFFFFFLFSFSFSFFLGLRADHTKNHISPSIYFVFEFNSSSLICNFFIYISYF